MKSILKYIFVDMLLMLIFIVFWYFSCFLLGYASNSEKYQYKIWIFYSIIILLHFILSVIILKRKNLNFLYVFINFFAYIIITVYLYSYT
ncbi:hypothetical protein SAMN05880573_1472 [Chryseobacterium sp. RU33C]|nr:hypothetical protein SAMN05880573_1472 [Chryseobacterium sp. RU33C]